MAKRVEHSAAALSNRGTCVIIAGVWLAGTALVAGAVLAPRRAEAVPAFAQQTGQPCKACHMGGFGPELTPFGREFKLGGYTLRAGPAIPISAMAISSWTHTKKDQVPPPEHLDRNNNLALDQVSGFLAGGIGNHFGGFVQVTYDGVGKAWAWDNLDLRAVTTTKVFGEDSTLGLSLNNSPTVQDPWNTYAAWGFPYTDTAVSETPGAAPLIDDALAQGVIGMTGYAWIGHKFYLEAGGYWSPSESTLNGLGADDPGKIHGVAPYGRVAFQTNLAGGTFEVGGVVLKAALFPDRDRSSGYSDRYTDLGLDSSWQRPIGKSDVVSLNARYVHEHGDLRASCALGIVGEEGDVNCANYHLNEFRGTVGYSWHGIVGADLSAFSTGGSRNFNLYDGSGHPDSNGLTAQLDYTPWGAGNSPLGPRFNARVGIQYTAYGKFNGRRHNYDGDGANASDNNAVRVFTWIAF
jgi:hypothetical protein